MPELRLDLPPTAIGKDYLGSSLIKKTSSGTGFQLSLGGLLGVLASWQVGLEINILGCIRPEMSRGSMEPSLGVFLATKHEPQII